jgi:hypothetical protein
MKLDAPHNNDAGSITSAFRILWFYSMTAAEQMCAHHMFSRRNVLEPLQ